MSFINVDNTETIPAADVKIGTFALIFGRVMEVYRISSYLDQVKFHVEGLDDDFDVFPRGVLYFSKDSKILVVKSAQEPKEA